MSDFDFQPYRDFILLDGDKQRALYTPTDALLLLQVGTLDRRKQGVQTESLPERTAEQLPVLEGLRKYALGDKRELVALEETCSCKKCIDSRRSVIDKLGKMGDEKVIPKVMSFLNNDDKGVRASAIEVTGILGDRNNIPDLLPFLRDPDSYIRYTTVVAIWELGIEPIYLS
jgi:HEAT repeat protein